MTVVIGLPRDERATAAAHLGALVARSLGEDVVVVNVVPRPWPAGPGKIDTEYRRFLDDSAREALDEGRELVPADVPASYEVRQARSTAAGLLDAATEHSASLVALGSSAASVLGRVAFGSVAERLLHMSPLPVALAPRGYRARPGTRLTQLTAAFAAAEGTEDAVLTAAGLATSAGATLRVASFALRARTPLTAGVGSRAEDAVLQAWESDVRQSQQELLARIAELPAPPPVDAVIGRGADWAAAVETIGWDEGSLLTIGSSSLGPVARVFLGSRASKIVRHSPAPVLVLPR